MAPTRHLVFLLPRPLPPRLHFYPYVVYDLLPLYSFFALMFSLFLLNFLRFPLFSSLRFLPFVIVLHKLGQYLSSPPPLHINLHFLPAPSRISCLFL